MRKEEIFFKAGYRVTETGTVLNKKGKVVSGYSNSNGYCCISCRDNTDIIKLAVHRLQAFQKYGELLFYKNVEVRHRNGAKEDNSYNNILIGTHSQNMMDIPEAIRIKNALHASSFVKKYNKEEVSLFHKQNGNSYKTTMQEFNITSKGTLHYLLNN